MNAKDVATYLRAELALTNVTYGTMPTEDDLVECATVFDYGGEPNVDVVGFDLYRFQVRVRGASYDTGYALSERIRTFLHAKADVAVGDWRARSIVARTTTMWFGLNANRRHEFTVNFEARAHKAQQ